MRQFDTGATRDTEEGKLDYEGHLSPIALEAFVRYMDSHRLQADGNLRSSDNWQKGMPLPVYIKSLFRHFMDVWRLHRSANRGDDPAAMVDSLSALWFNVQGYMHEYIKEHGDGRSVHTPDV